MANDSRFRRTAGRCDGPDFANLWRGPALPPLAAGLSQVVRDVVAARIDTTLSTNAGLAALNARRDEGPVIYRALVAKGAAGGGVVGIGPLLRRDKWIAGQWDEALAGNDFIPDTAAARDNTVNDFELLPFADAAVGGAVNDGFVVGASEPFSLLRIDMTGGTLQAAGGAPVAEMQYWNGTAWAALTPLAFAPGASLNTLFAAAAGAIGVLREILFVPPADWTASTGAAPGEGIAAGNFLVKFRWTALPVTRGIASIVQVGHPLMLSHRGLAGDTMADLVPAAGYPFVCGDAGDGVCIAWDAASANNKAFVQGEDVGYVGTLGSTHGG